MKKIFQRWYQKNEYLNAFISLLEDLPIEEQCEIAIDIIIEASDLLERNYTKLTKEISSFNPKDYKRWYDKNPNIHLAVESLKDLNEEEREKIISRFSGRILSSKNFKSKIDENLDNV